MAPLTAGGHYYQPLPNPHSNWIVVNRDFEHPEAVIKMLNLTNFILGQQAEADEYFPNTTTTHGEIYHLLNRSWTMWPFQLQLNWNDNMLRLADDVSRSLAAGNDSAFNPSFDSYVEGYRGFRANPGADVDDTIMYMNTRAVILQLENDHLLRHPRLGFPGVTDTMATRWAHLQTLENQALMQIVMGIEPIEHFDTFVEQWLDQGGRQITEEVNTQLRR